MGNINDNNHINNHIGPLVNMVTVGDRTGDEFVERMIDAAREVESTLFDMQRQIADSLGWASGELNFLSPPAKGCSTSRPGISSGK